MAEPRVTPADGHEGNVEPRPFDRQALQATLADAVRTADVAGGEAEQAVAGAASRRGPSPQDMIAGATRPDATRAKPPAGRAPNPFSGGSNARPPQPEAAPGQPRAASPGAPGQLAPPAAPAVSGLSGAGALGGGLRNANPANLGPMGRGGAESRAVPGELAPNRPAPVAAQQQRPTPTIPLRRRQPQPAVARDDPKEAAAPQGPPPPPQAATRAAVPMPTWSPGDDDILPQRQPKRSFRISR